MAYSILDDLKKQIDESSLIQLTDTTGAGAVDQIKTDRAIRFADALIDSYVSKVYTVPLSPIPDLVRELSATIAIVNLHRFRSVDSPVWNRAYENATATLVRISKGELTLDNAGVAPSPSATQASSSTFEAEQRRFSRDLLKDM